MRKGKEKDRELQMVVTLAMKVTKLSVNEVSFVKRVYEDVSQEVFYNYAKERKVLPFVASLFSDLDIDHSFWEEIYFKYENRNRKIIDLLSKIFKEFKTNNIGKVFVYENFGAVLSSDVKIGSFASGDCDLYADSSFKEKISKILEIEGFIPKCRKHSTEKVKTEFFNKHLFDKGFGINVMWKPMSRLKIPFNINIENVINWSSLREYKDTNILLPDPDSLMYLCLLHISIHSYNRNPDIRLYSDITRLSLLNPDWERIALLSQYDETIIRTRTSTILTQKLLDIPLPDSWQTTYKNNHDKRINRLLKVVFDERANLLKKEAHGLRVLLIELLSSDSSIAKAFIKILFPSRRWIKEFYLEGRGPIVKGYLLHLKNLI